MAHGSWLMGHDHHLAIAWPWPVALDLVLPGLPHAWTLGAPGFQVLDNWPWPAYGHGFVGHFRGIVLESFLINDNWFLIMSLDNWFF